VTIFCGQNLIENQTLTNRKKNQKRKVSNSCKKRKKKKDKKVKKIKNKKSFITCNQQVLNLRPEE